MRCYECDEDIELGDGYIEFEDKSFHEDCFEDWVWYTKKYMTNDKENFEG